MAVAAEMTSPVPTPFYSNREMGRPPGFSYSSSENEGGILLNSIGLTTSMTTPFSDALLAQHKTVAAEWDRNVSLSSGGTTLATLGSGRLCPIDEGNSTGYGYDFYVTARMVTGLFIYPSFCFPGLVGNILTVIVLSQRNMLTSTNAFLSALAVSDSIKLINDSLYFFVTLFFNIDPVLGFSSYGYLYPYAHFIFSMSVCVSSWLTVSVAVERYILVCHPTRARNFWSRQRAVMLCCIIYVVMTSLALPSAFRYRTIRCFDVQLNTSRLEVELTEMWQNETFVTSYTWAQTLIRSIIPLIVLVVLNVCIIRAVRRTKVKKKRKNSRHRVTIMMIVVILTFLICITPDAILSTIFGRGYHEAGMVTKGIREITDSLLTVNAAVNFIIYCALNKVFRKSFSRLCCPRSRRQGDGWVTEMDESVYRRFSEAKVSMLSSNNNHSTHRNDPETSENCDNNSVFSPSTPKSAISTDEANRFRYSSLSGGPSSPESPGFSSERLALFSSPSGKPTACVTDSTKSEGCVDRSNHQRRQNNRRSLNNQYRNSWNDSHHHHHHNHNQQQKHPKSSSHGLKKSRNSVKCNRRKRTTSSSSGDKSFNTEDYEVFQNETVTYIPKEEFQNSLRRLSSGKQNNKRQQHALKSVDDANVDNQVVQNKLVNPEKRLVLDLKQNGNDVTINSSSSSSQNNNYDNDNILSPDSAPYTPHNAESPKTLYSDVIIIDDDDKQCDDFQNNDSSAAVAQNYNNDNNVHSLTLTEAERNNTRDNENSVLPKLNGTTVHKDGSSPKVGTPSPNGDAPLLNSRVKEDTIRGDTPAEKTGISNWDVSPSLPPNINKLKKRPLTVSFSDC